MQLCFLLRGRLFYFKLLLAIILLCRSLAPCGVTAEDSHEPDPWERALGATEEPGTLHTAQNGIPLTFPVEERRVSQQAAGPVGSTIWQNLTVRRFKRTKVLMNACRIELAILAFCVIYIINIFRGRQANRVIARAWADEFCKESGIFKQNFALLGSEGEFGAGESSAPLVRLSGSEYQLYCTGRRFCKFAEATLKLRSRQDLFALLIGLLYPTDDLIDVEVYMKETDMPQMVVAVATKKLIRAALREETGEEDIRSLTHKMEVARDRIPSWPSDRLAVQAEHSSLFYDIMTEKLIDQVFSQQAFAIHGQYFRLLHFTSEQSYGPEDQRAVLRFQFALPPAGQMHELTKLISSIAVFTDTVGAYKLTPDLRKRAEKLRQDVNRKAFKEKAKDHQEVAEERKVARRAEELERLKRMTPEQREKYEARKAKIENSRAQKKFVKRG